MKQNRTFFFLLFGILLALFVAVPCHCSSAPTNPQITEIISHLDNQVRSVYNLQSQLSTYKYQNSENKSTVYLEYVSGFKIILSITGNSIQVLQYELGNENEVKGVNECKGQCKKGKNQVDTEVRKKGYIDSNYSIDKFDVTANGYQMKYVFGQIIILLDLDWNLNLIKRDTQVITASTLSSTSSSTTISSSSNNQQLIRQFIAQILPQYFQKPQIQSIVQVSPTIYKITVLLPINSRLVKYEVLLGQSNSKFEIQDTRYLIDYVPAFKPYLPNKDIKAGLDRVIKQQLIKKGGYYVLPNDVQIEGMERDEPIIRSIYNNIKSRYFVDIVYDPIKNSINVIGFQIKDLPNVTTTVSTSIDSDTRTITISTPPTTTTTTTITTDQSSFSTQVSQQVKERLTTFVGQYFSSLLPENTTVGEIIRISSSKFGLNLNLPLGSQRVGYKITLVDLGDGKFSIQNGEYENVGEAKFDKFIGDNKTIEELDMMVHEKLGQQIRNGKIIQIEVDEPKWRLTYNVVTVNIVVEFLYDFLMNKISVVHVNQFDVVNPITDQLTVLVHNNQTIGLENHGQTVIIPIIDKSEIPLVPIQTSITANSQPSITVQITDTTTDTTIDTATNETTIPIENTTGDSFSSSEYSLLAYKNLSSEVDEMTLKLADIALNKISGELQKIDKQYKLRKIGYFIKDQSTTIFKFQINTSTGLYTYYYQLILDTLPQPVNTTIITNTSQQSHQQVQNNINGSVITQQTNHNQNNQVPSTTEPTSTSQHQLPTIPIHPIQQPKSTSIETPHTVLLSTSQKVLTSFPAISQSSLIQMLEPLQSQFPSIQLQLSNIISSQKIGDSYRIILLISSEYYEIILSSTYSIISSTKLSSAFFESPSAQIPKFYEIRLTQQIKLMLLSALGTKINNNLSILKSQIKVSGDGVYYRLVLEGTSGTWNAIVYMMEGSQYIEILEFNKGEMNLSWQNVQIQGQESLRVVMQFMLKQFDFLVDADLISISKSMTSTLVFKTIVKLQNVFYEIHTSLVSYSSSFTPQIIFYKKINNGYFQEPSSSTKNQLAQFIQNQFSILLPQQTVSVQDVYLRNLMNYGKFYRSIVVGSWGKAEVIAFLSGNQWKIKGIEGIIPWEWETAGKTFSSLGKLREIVLLIQQLITAKTIIVTPTPVTRPTPNPTPTLIEYGYDASKDFNCLRSSGVGCVRCAYRYYLLNSQCVQVPNQCKQYNRQTGECQSCYTGYFLSSGVCSTGNPLCLMTDTFGRCTRCYQDYDLSQGQCYRSISVGSGKNSNYYDSIVAVNDPLCQQFSTKCLKCTAGSYLSKITGKCKLRDPYADEFDEIGQVSVRCIRGYTVRNGMCVKN